jgi:hypothetical protein
MKTTREVQERINEVKYQMEKGIEMAQKKYPKLTMEEVTNVALQIALKINEVEIETYCEG